MTSLFSVAWGDSNSEAAESKTLFDIGIASWSCSILRAFCAFEIPERLADGPKSAEQLAEECSASAAHMFRFLRAASLIGVCAQKEGTVFELTPMGECCKADHPKSMRGFLLLFASPEHTKCWTYLEHVIKTGETAVKPALGVESYFELFKKDPGHVKLFEDGMKSFMEAPVVESSVFDGTQKFVDIGAGHGVLIMDLLRKYPKAEGVICDLPEVVDLVKIPEELKDRCSTQAVNFLIDNFDSIKTICGADAYILKHVIHNWGDEVCVKLLTEISNVMAPNGKVFIIESGPVPADNTPHFSKIADIAMAVLTGSKERTREEHDKLCEQAGLKIEGVEVLNGPSCIISVVKA